MKKPPIPALRIASIWRQRRPVSSRSFQDQNGASRQMGEGSFHWANSSFERGIAVSLPLSRQVSDLVGKAQRKLVPWAQIVLPGHPLLVEDVP
jgi:hypothetical protein